MERTIKIRALLPPAALLFFLSDGTAFGADAEVGSRIEEVAPSVFAVLQPEANRFNESNSVFVIRDRGVLVVDAQSTLEATGRVIEAIRARTELPVRHLVLTHWHGDHVHGIAAYREAWPGVQVIGHTAVAEEIRSRAQAQLEEDTGLYDQAIADARDRLERRVDREGEALDDAGVERLSGQIAAAEATLSSLRAVPLPLAVPDLAYTDELIIGSGPSAVRLFHRTAHTRGDTLVHLPAAGVLITGDVLDDLPFGGHGYPKSWLAALDELDGLEFEVIVPGHGRTRPGKEHLRRVRDMLRSLTGQVNAAVARGMDLEATQAAVELQAFRETLAGDDPVAARSWNGFVPPTIERAWLEARGELPD